MIAELTTIDPRVAQELSVITEALAVSLGVKELTPAFIERRDELTAIAYGFETPPTTDEEQSEILSAQRNVAKLRTELTKNGAALRGPLNTAKTKISEIENGAVEFLKKAEAHCQGLVNFRQNKLLAERRAEEQRIETERKRLADQAAQAEREQQEAERKRQAAALAEQQAQEATTKAARDKAAAEALRLTQEAEALDTAAYEKEIEAALAPMAQAASAPAPQAREIRDFVLIGRNEAERKDSLRRLLAAHPEFFALEAKDETPRAFSLKLRIQDLTDALNGKAPFAKLDTAPGITVSTKLSVLR